MCQVLSALIVGKLQTLDALLRGLKTESHRLVFKNGVQYYCNSIYLYFFRVLIFTQMSRVLDILEIFLNYHGHTYLRLDGTTPVQKRQVEMQVFLFLHVSHMKSAFTGFNGSV